VYPLVSLRTRTGILSKGTPSPFEHRTRFRTSLAALERERCRRLYYFFRRSVCDRPQPLSTAKLSTSVQLVFSSRSQVPKNLPV